MGQGVEAVAPERESARDAFAIGDSESRLLRLRVYDIAS